MSPDHTPGATGDGPEQERPEPVVRDRRRVDETGALRDPATADAFSAPVEDTVDVTPAPADDEVAQARARAAEHLEDLQRLQAEYANYRKRVERDRLVARDQTVAAFAEALIPALDDIELARRHGELVEGPFAAIVEKLEAVLGRFGIVRYGEAGEEFDPAVHEALMHSHSAEVDGPTVTEVLQPGYRAGERIVRAARVAVAEPGA